MKKIIVALVLLCSCGGESVVNLKPETNKDTITVDESAQDSLTKRVEDLLDSTQGVEKKVDEIKTIKQENLVLKKELSETKQELFLIKEQLIDTTSEESPIKKKKNFIQKVVSTFKKDTIQ